MQAPTNHLPRAQQQQQPQHPSLFLSSAQHPSSARQSLGRISSVKAPFCIWVECRAQDKFLLLRNQL